MLGFIFPERRVHTILEYGPYTITISKLQQLFNRARPYRSAEPITLPPDLTSDRVLVICIVSGEVGSNWADSTESDMSAPDAYATTAAASALSGRITSVVVPLARIRSIAAAMISRGERPGFSLAFSS